MKNEISWIDWFLKQPRANLYIKVDSDYISNFFNFYGIKQQINHFLPAFDLLSKNYIPPFHADIDKENESIVIQQQAEILYGMIHSRFILTEKGLEKISEKYFKEGFPKCPRILCENITCLPYGVTTDLNEYPVKLFCPRCGDIYNIKDQYLQKIDGAFFGPSYVHLFIKKYSSFLPKDQPISFIPRIFGFKIKKSSYKEEEDITE